MCSYRHIQMCFKLDCAYKLALCTNLDCLNLCQQLVTSSSLLFKMPHVNMSFERVHSLLLYQSSHPRSLLIHCSCQDVKESSLLMSRLQGYALCHFKHLSLKAIIECHQSLSLHIIVTDMLRLSLSSKLLYYSLTVALLNQLNQ